MKKSCVLLVCLLLLWGCGIGSMRQGNLDMEAALINMAVEMRNKEIGVMMNEQNGDPAALQKAYGISLPQGEYAFVRSIRADVWQEAAIFHCNEENRSIIKEKAQTRCRQAKAQGVPAELGVCGDYVYLLIGENALWMRTYLEGL